MPYRRALIFVNGEQMDLPAVRDMLRADDYRIAADGGLRFLTRLGLRPHLLIGDLDSVSPADLEQIRQSGDVRIDRYPTHKDETDLELAVLAAVHEGCREILLLGALGGRLDMTLANIFLLALPELAGIDARLEDGREEVFLIEPGPGREIIGHLGDRVSLLPWGGPAAGITTAGLEYPLLGEMLYPERTRGISNVLLASPARVTLEHGRLICIHTRKE
jgi:thiamine pyrophosphokinase